MLLIQDGDSYSVYDGHWNKNGRGSQRPVVMSAEETRLYRAGHTGPLVSLRATAQDRANRNGEEVSILTADGEEVEWCTPLGAAFERNGRRTGILSDGTRVNVYHDDTGSGDPWTVVPHGIEWDQQARGDMRSMLGLSETATGISQWSEGQEGRHLGRSVPWDAVPPEIKRHIEQRVVGETMVANTRRATELTVPPHAEPDDYVIGVTNRDSEISLFRVRSGPDLFEIECSADLSAIARAAEIDARNRGTGDAVVWEYDDGRFRQAGHVLHGRWQVGHTPNARGTTADANAVRELSLYIENDFALIGAPNSKGKSIDGNLRKKVAAGKYDPKLAPTLWGYLIEDGARKYAKEYATPGDWAQMFNAATRKQVAEDFARAWEAENLR